MRNQGGGIDERVKQERKGFKMFSLAKSIASCTCSVLRPFYKRGDAVKICGKLVLFQFGSIKVREMTK